MFERNQGQAAQDVRFLTRSHGRTILFRDQQISMVGAHSQVSLVFEGSMPGPRISGESPLVTKLNYLPAPDPKSWVSGVENFASVRYHDVYPGIDVLVHATRGELEYDLLARPGADLGAVSIRFDGTDQAVINKDGDIEVETADGAIHQRLPEAYQEPAGSGRTKVDARYVRKPDGAFRFELGEYDPAQELVVDPVIGFSTFIGRSEFQLGDLNFAQNPGNWQFTNVLTKEFNPMAVDSQGYSYIAGTIATPELAWPIQRIGTTSGNGLVCKINPTGDTVVFCTIAWADVQALSLDGSGNLYIGGTGYIAKLPPQGDRILWNFATGSVHPLSSIAVDQAGAVVAVEGNMQSQVFKVKPDGSGLGYSTAIGTPAQDVALAVALDTQGNAYVTGGAVTASFPRTAGASPGLNTGTHIYVAKLTPQGQLVYSMVVPQSVAYLPMAGTAYSVGQSIAVDSQGAAYVVGRTSAVDLPASSGAAQPGHGGALMDGFALKVNPAGTALDYLTYLGGYGMDEALGVTVDVSGNAYLTGRSQGQGFPTSDSTGSPLLTVGSSSAFFLPQGGLYRRSNDGWSERIRSLAMNPLNPLVIYASSGFQGQLMKSTNGGLNWSYLPSPASGEIERILLDPVNPAILWAGSTNHFWRSTDAGASWTSIPIPLTNLNGMKADPKNQSIRYAFGYSATQPAVVRSTDAGATWQSLGSLNVNYSCFYPYCAVSDLLIDPSNSSMLYAAADSGVYASPNGGVSWVSPNQMPYAQMVDVKFDPTNSQVVWGAGYGGIQKSIDRGVSWTYVYLDYSESALAVIPHPLGGSVYAITGQHYNNVIESRDGGTTWASATVPGPIFAGAADPSAPGKYLLGGGSPFHAFLAKLSPNGSNFLYSGCFGGSNDEAGSAIVRDAGGRLYVGGVAASLDFPVSVGAAQRAFGGRNAWFITQFTEGPPSAVQVQVSPTSVSLGLGQTRQFTAVVTGGTGAVSWSIQPAGAGTVSASGLYTAPATAGPSTVTVVATSIADPGRSGTATVTLPNPVPTLFALGNYSVLAGSPGITVAVTGTGFVPSSVVRWNGADRKTYYMSSQYLKFDIPASDLVLAGKAVVNVYTPPVGGGTTGAHYFTIVNRAPVLTSLSHYSAMAWTSGTTVTVNGNNFEAGAAVRWNGADRSTTRLSSTQLKVDIPASDLLGASTNTITVNNPAPGGGDSAGLTFTVVDTLPRVLGVTPSSGGGEFASFQASYAFASDYRKLAWVQLLFAVAPDGGGQPYCFVHYDVQGDGFWVYGDGGFFQGPVKPGNASFALQNSFCALNTATSSISGNAGTLTMKANVVFKAAGARNLYLRSFSVSQEDSNWVQMGSWSAAKSAMGAMQAAPGSGAGTRQTFRLTYNDPNGFAGTTGGWSQFLVATAPDAAAQNFCFIHYDRAGQGLWMYSSDVGFFLGPVKPGLASNALDSSACSIDTAATTATSQSGALVVTVPVTFKPPMAGGMNLYQRVFDPLGRDSGWVLRGGWTIP